MAPTADVTLDTSGLSCPMPILKAKQTIDGLQNGQVLKLIATDPGSVGDVTVWTNKTGHELLEHHAEGAAFVFYIRKS